MSLFPTLMSPSFVSSPDPWLEIETLFLRLKQFVLENDMQTKRILQTYSKWGSGPNLQRMTCIVLYCIVLCHLCIWLVTVCKILSLCISQIVINCHKTKLRIRNIESSGCCLIIYLAAWALVDFLSLTSV